MKAHTIGREVEYEEIPSDAKKGDFLVKDGKIKSVVPPIVFSALYRGDEYMKIEPTAVPISEPKKFFEPDKPWYSMTAEEWHAFGYGLKDGFKFWKRTHLLYSQIDALDQSPEVKQALKNKWHYYEIGSDLPEDVALLACILYLIISGQAGNFINVIVTNAGVIL